ncbi:transglutaminase-like domain-containing protein [Ancylobacter amanitiformis]|uniref:Transglutaminase-like putative cysteine protease n=1 Tax=Ancylobacter amanitiformis TaxID=217069 RepID=A0ABU0LWT2_9HYPH|nr:transglutaminase domain-containing protein [Ancylobacter amanitiformis]MDQ0513125.1 transglutaminase-like putative cysteine protease [Ancylobacter amanitiformis]
MTSRRELLKAGAALAAATLAPSQLFAQTAATAAGATFAPQPGKWRSFDVVTTLEVAPIAGKPGPAQAWVPLPSYTAADWFKPGTSTWKTNAASATVVKDPHYGTELLHLTWAEGESAPRVEITSSFATRDRATDFAKPGSVAPLSSADRALFTAPTELIPLDGIVKQTSDTITAGKASDLEKARAIYEWVVENTYRNAATRGCGTGDVASLLKSGNLGGKCADLNALYVGLVRAAGIPARDIYGIRVAPSAFGYKSLGANSPTISKAQHCRAEVWLDGFGWVATDPADVRKVVLEEPPGKNAMDDAKVLAARKALFGAWEGNWLAYNDGHDIALPGSNGPRLGFLMYPQAEMASLRHDCLDPDTFKYSITASELAT